MTTKKKALPGKKAVLDNIMEYFSFSAIVILLLALSLTQENFLGEINLKNLLRDTAPLMIMASGMTMVLLFGSIDLSMGAVCSVSNVAFVHFMLAYGEGFGNPMLAGLTALAVSLAFGLCSGLTLGFIHVKLKVPSFIASLGFMSVWQSAALLITQGPESMKKALWPATEWYKVSFGVVGLPLVLALIIIILVYLLTRFTAFGKAVFAIGGNERAARVAGIHVDRTKITVFALNGVLAALAGVFLAANLRSSAPTIGDPFTLKIVAACALGGTSLAGGKGSELGTILGVFTVAIIENGMNFIGVDAYWQNVVFGIFVLAAIALTVDRRTRGQIIK
ncbi:MAG: ABC transporter permease [Oscillospiraceae bacterium]|jgi:ribose/xylose/arabinose/galactoside ABC-type transport system permease subunit|nr:ABC transporter permease [Oscillospiraceae bacterium]